MNAHFALMVAGLVGVGALILLLVMVRYIRLRSREVPDAPGLWSGRGYACPGCGGPMVEGWLLFGRGAVWSPRAKGPPGTFVTIAESLPNTLSLSLRPAGNQAWRCGDCRLVIFDHSRLVKPSGGR